MKILYSFILLCCFANTFNANAQFREQAQQKYNVVFIIVDDLNIAFDAFGNPQAPTPNFTRLMQHGMLFNDTYCQYPLCSPSRTSLLSGRRPDSTGVVNNGSDVRWKLGKNYRFLPEYFHDNGYRTENFGKVGPCGHERQISWDNYVKASSDTVEFNGTPFWWVDTLHKMVSELTDGVNVDSFLAKIKHPVASPYFYGLGLQTHNPYVPILSSWNKIGDSTKKEFLPVDRFGTITDVKGNHSRNIVLPKTPVDDTADIPKTALTPLFDYSKIEVKDLRHAYYAEIIEMDKNLGKILDGLDNLNLWDNTVVVFTSDHGLHLGEHLGLWLKLTLFEEALRVPFVICAPGKMKGVCYKPVELVDIFSTLTDLCGLPAAPQQQGFSLVPLLENPDALWNKAIFSQRVLHLAHNQPTDSMGRAVRTSRYHYNTWLGSGEELYDIVKDPKEYTNLAKDSAHQDVLNKMRALLEKGWQGVPAPVYTRASYYRDADDDGYGNSVEKVLAYFKPDGYVSEKGDCDDTNADINPRSAKITGGQDDDCNFTVTKFHEAIALQPNPSTGNVTVTYNSKDNYNIKIKVYNITGNLVFSQAGIAMKGTNNYSLNLPGLRAGMYDLELNNGILPLRTKLLIEK